MVIRRSYFPFIVLFLIIIFHFVPFFNGFEAKISRTVMGVGFVIRGGALSVREFFINISNFAAIAKENNLLKDQIIYLREQVAIAVSLETENDNLKGLIEYKSRNDLNFISAEVIGADPDATIRALVINRGREEGITRGDAVIVGNGTMIGKIERVSDGHSTVLLLTDPRSAVAAMLAERPEANGVAAGEKGLVILMTLIPQHAKVEKGDTVVTTGRDGQIPRGLVLGVIDNIFAVPSDSFASATIIPAIDPIEISKVAVIHQK